MSDQHIEEVDRVSLENKVKEMYEQVATHPNQSFHFETGRALAERLGYPASELDQIPQEAIASFAGVGYFFHLGKPTAGETVLDLGSGSGMDAFFAANRVGRQGTVVGIDMTDAQLEKAGRLRVRKGFAQVQFVKGYIEDLNMDDESVDVVISNGVINLSADKRAVFREVARVLRSGGRLALSDIVTYTRLPESITCDASLWAACIGGAQPEDSYTKMIEEARLRVVKIENNDTYQFLSDGAQGATKKWGVKSISLLAVKDA